MQFAAPCTFIGPTYASVTELFTSVYYLGYTTLWSEITGWIMISGCYQSWSIILGRIAIILTRSWWLYGYGQPGWKQSRWIAILKYLFGRSSFPRMILRQCFYPSGWCTVHHFWYTSSNESTCATADYCKRNETGCRIRYTSMPASCE